MSQTDVKEDPLLGDDEKQFSRSNYDNSYKDILFLFLFAANLILVISVAFSYGIISLANGGPGTVRISADGTESDETSHLPTALFVISGIFLIIGIAVVLSVAWILFLARLAAHIINAILISIIIVPTIFGLIVFLSGFYLFGSSLIALSVAMLVFSLIIRPRMDFAVSNLRVASEAILQVPVTIAFSLIGLVTQVAFVMIWALAVVGYATNSYKISLHRGDEFFRMGECTTYNFKDDVTIGDYSLTCDGKSTCHACFCGGDDILVYSSSACYTPQLYAWPFTLMLLSLFWTSAVISNVVHCTTSAAVASWWVTPVARSSSVAVHDAFLRSVSTSLGSICLGSLLVAVVRTLRSILYFATRRMQISSHGQQQPSSAQSMLWGLAGRSGTTSTGTSTLRLAGSALTGVTGVCRSFQAVSVYLLQLLLRLLDWLVTYFNRYALCFVAIYRYDFLQASYAATELLQERGLTAFLNDDILDVILAVGHLTIGMVCMCAGFIYGKLVGVGSAYTLLLTVFGLVCGYLISTVTLATIASAVSAVYVCFAESPESLEDFHPEAFEILYQAYAKMFPASFQQDQPQESQQQQQQYGIDCEKQLQPQPGTAVTLQAGMSSSGQSAQSRKVSAGEVAPENIHMEPMNIQAGLPTGLQQHQQHPGRTIRGSYQAPIYIPRPLLEQHQGLNHEPEEFMLNEHKQQYPQQYPQQQYSQQQYSQQQQLQQGQCRQEHYQQGAGLSMSGLSGGVSQFLGTFRSSTQSFFGYSQVAVGEDYGENGAEPAGGEGRRGEGGGGGERGGVIGHVVQEDIEGTERLLGGRSSSGNIGGGYMRDLSSAATAIGSLASKLSDSVFGSSRNHASCNSNGGSSFGGGGSSGSGGVEWGASEQEAGSPTRPFMRQTFKTSGGQTSASTAPASAADFGVPEFGLRNVGGPWRPAARTDVGAVGLRVGDSGGHRWGTHSHEHRQENEKSVHNKDRSAYNFGSVQTASSAVVLSAASSGVGAGQRGSSTTFGVRNPTALRPGRGSNGGRGSGGGLQPATTSNTSGASLTGPLQQQHQHQGQQQGSVATASSTSTRSIGSLADVSLGETILEL